MKDRQRDSQGSSSDHSPLVPVTQVRTIAPFIPSQDFARGAFHALQSLIRFVIMLSIMWVVSPYMCVLRYLTFHELRTFQAAYFITLIVGLSIGEVLFGRQIALDIHGSAHVH